MSNIVEEYAEEVSTCLCQLLQEKHLYQSISVAPSDVIRELATGISLNEAAGSAQVKQLARLPWFIKTSSERRRDALAGAKEPGVRVEVRGLKLVCGLCDRLEAFNPISSIQLELVPLSGEEARRSKTSIQVWAISFQCQSCKSDGDVFLVRREGTKLMLSGRAPIEALQLPRALPKQESSYFADAVVGFNSGQVLAGLFLLRVFVEQFVRRQMSAPSSEDSDRTMERYMESLPTDFKSRFSSLRDIYSELSDAMHSARADAQLFATASEKLVNHFEARRLYKL